MSQPLVQEPTHDQSAVSQKEHLPGKRFFYGYFMLPIAALAQICTAPGQTFAVSAFIPSIRDALGMSETRLTTAYMIGTFVAAFPLMIVGPIADRIGNRKTMMIVVVLLSCACFFASTVTSFTSLLIAFLSLRFLGQGSLTLLSGNTTSMWFRHKLGRVTALMSIGMAGAFAVIPGWLLWGIENYGWRETYRGLGVIVAVLMLPLLVFVFRDRPEDVNQHLDGVSPPKTKESVTTIASTTTADDVSFSIGQALRHRSFYILTISMAAWGMIGTGLVFYLLSIGEARGFDHATTARVFTTFAVSMLAMQLVGGVMADRFPLNRLLCLGLSFLTAGTLCVLFVTELWHLHLFGALFGAGQGTTIAVGATVWVRYYGRDHLGKIRGTAWSASVAGSGSGPFLLGWAKDYGGTFDPAIITFVALLIPLTLLALLATPPPANQETSATE